MLIFSYTVSLATKMDKIQTFFSCINYTKNTPNTDAEDKDIRVMWIVVYYHKLKGIQEILIS